MAAFEGVSQPFGFMEEVVGNRFAGISGNAGIAKAVSAYVMVTLGAFIAEDAMRGRYNRERAMFAMLAGDDYFDATLGEIQKGDVNLFHTMFIRAAPYAVMITGEAARSYHAVSSLIKANRKNGDFFGFMSRRINDIVEVMRDIGDELNLASGNVATASLEAHIRSYQT